MKIFFGNKNNSKNQNMAQKYVIIGGSAGSFQSITEILSELPKNYDATVFLCLHRLKHVRTGFVEALSIKSKLPISEPIDKEFIKNGRVYLAPANYHMYFELGNSFSLSTETAVNHSRPSIDLSFESAAYIFREKLTAVLLSGANRDGAHGMKIVNKYGGSTVVQDPEECQVKTMTTSAIAVTKINHILYLKDIIKHLKKI